MTRILVVDDEAVILKFLVRVLKREGYTVYPASNGLEALRVLDHFSIDLLLTDIKMSEMDGISLLKEGRARFPDMAIILLTGHATVESAVVALQEGAFNYLLKPVKNEDLITAVQEALQKQDREKQRNRLEALAVNFAKTLDYRMTTAKTETLEFKALRIDKSTHIAVIEEEVLDLTPTEFRLLWALCETPGQTFDYVHLVHVACGYLCDRQAAREIIGTHVRNLRQKLAEHPDHPIAIESVWGVGYRLA